MGTIVLTMNEEVVEGLVIVLGNSNDLGFEQISDSLKKVLSGERNVSGEPGEFEVSHV